MNKGCWKVDENDEAIYIDVEEDIEDDKNHEYSHWPEIPDLLMENILQQLTIRQRYYTSIVCRSWFRAFHLPGVWSHFVLEDTTLTRAKFNYYSGWQYVLDHLRTSMCLSTIGRHFRKLTFEPMLNFYNLYEFMNMLSWFIEQARSPKPSKQFEGIGTRIRSLKYTFPCNMASRDETERLRLFGTGGKLLDAVKRLMYNLPEIRHLELIDLMLDRNEARHLLDGVCINAYDTLRVLVLINTTKLTCPLLHVGVFLKLNTLVISPQSIDDDVIELLGYTRLLNLHIIQNRYTPNDSTIRPASPKVWRSCRKNNPHLSVHLELESIREKEILWQEYAPVKTVLYDSPQVKFNSETLIQAVQMYKDTLITYGHKNLPRFHQPKSFHDRIDSLLVYLCRQAPKLKILIVRERISTATILLVAYTARNLRNLYIRRNAVILRADWPKCPDWSDEFYEWLRSNSRSYETVETEVSQILGYRWTMLTDKQFKSIPIMVHATGY